MTMNEKLIKLSNKQLFFNPLYWFQKDFPFLFLLSFCVLACTLLFKLNFPKNDDPLLIISLIIYVFGIWGVIIVAKNLVYLNIEKSIAHKIVVIFSEELFKIRGKEKDRINVERILELLPTTSKHHESTMIRLINHIVDDARDRKFESGDVMMRIYKEEIISQLFKINSAQKIALRLGILGTFIGLIIAFMNLSNISNIDENFEEITSALQYAFSTSIAGLLTSIILALNSILLNKRQEKYFKIMEEATQVTIALARNSINKDTFMADFEQMRMSLDGVQRGVNDQQIEIKNQTNTIKEGLHSLQISKKNFDEYFSNIAEEMKRVYEILSPEKMSQKLKESMEQSVVGISEAIDTNISSHLKQYNELNTTMESLGKNLNKIESQLKNQITLNNEAITKSKHDTYKAINELTKIQKEYLSAISKSQTKEHVEALFKNVETGIKNKLDEKSDTIVNVIEKLESSLSSYNTIIQTKIPKYSRIKIIRNTVIITSVIGLGLAYLFYPDFKYNISQLFEYLFLL